MNLIDLFKSTIYIQIDSKEIKIMHIESGREQTLIPVASVSLAKDGGVEIFDIGTDKLICIDPSNFSITSS